jgi:hypothetical protein
VRGARWTELDTIGKVWTIPAERMKAKREHQVPDAVERAYQRGSQFAKRTGLMTDWSVYCASTQTDAAVKSILSKAESSKMD